MVDANETSSVPMPRPKMAPAAKVRMVAPGTESAIITT